MEMQGSFLIAEVQVFSSVREAGVNRSFKESTIFSGHSGSGREYYLENEKLCRKERKVVMSGGFYPKLWDFFLALLRFRSPDSGCQDNPELEVCTKVCRRLRDKS